MKKLDNNPYKINSLLGKGSFGVVHSAISPLNNELVAIKII